MLSFPGFGRIEKKTNNSITYNNDVIKPSLKVVMPYPREKHFQSRIKFQSVYNTIFQTRKSKSISKYTSPYTLLESLKCSVSEDDIVVLSNLIILIAITEMYNYTNNIR